MSITFFFMIAVVELGGKQYTVEVGQALVVDHQHHDVGTSFDVAAMLVASPDGKTVKVGTPTVDGSKVTLKVEEHFKGEKVRVFKIKSKKRYMRTAGFRPHQTRLVVESIA
ncbi:MAG: 50S ribosomal protein L21 [Patescibacteria group bacterium]